MNVGEICKREVVTIQKTASVAEAALRMREKHVGSLVVAEGRPGSEKPLGIVTDRDLVIEVLAEGVDPGSVLIDDLMQRELLLAAEDAPVSDAIHLMRTEGVRRLPVVNAAGGLAGILSLDDFLQFLAVELHDLVKITDRERAEEVRKRTVA